MVNGSLFVVPARRTVLLLCLVVASLAASIAAPSAHAQGEGKRLLIYTGTTGFRHTDAINNGRPVVQSALQALGYTVDWEDCNGNGGGAANCDNADKNPRIFSTANLAQYDAIVFFNASWSWAGGGLAGPLLNEAQRNAVISYVQNGGGITAIHNSTDMGAGVSVWDWWDGGPNSVVGTTMPGHSANSTTGNAATVMVEDQNHLATRDLPDTFTFADEHYNYARNVRGDHHVLANFDERTYNTGTFSMGQDHPIAWCKLYDGDNVNDGTGTPKSYFDGRTWVTGMGHNGVRFTENGGDNNFVKMVVGGIRWVAGEGRKSDCSGTVWTSFTRTVLVPDANGPIGIDVSKDGKVYWSEIGTTGFTGEGYVKMHDPTGPASNKTTVATIPTRADHGNSEDGVLGMSLEPDFDLADPQKRDLFVYYSPRPGTGDNWPTTGNAQTVGYNQVSRFTLNAAGTAVEPGSERVILRVPKAKIAGSPSGFPGGPTDSGPGHVGGAGLDFDSEGNLYLGVGDDVSPNAPGHGGYPPMDYRSSERWDARKTSANSADLRGKVLRIKPLDDIASGTNPGVDATYSIPAGNMFPTGTANARPEIYAMGFRQPFTVHTDPANPGTVTVGEYCHDANANGTQRAPAGTCEWNLLQQPGFHGWPFCVGNNSVENTSWRWNYAANATTGSQYDCSLSSLPSDINYAPDGQSSAAPSFQGQANIPGPAVPATIWKKYAGASGGQSTADFGDLSAGGMQPVTGPIYRYDEDTAGPGAFPAYYDGSWLINNRGGDNGFWKEVRLREDNNRMLHVHDWLPYNAAGSGSGQFNSLVIGTQFGPDGALYMARFPVTCCRNNTNPGSQTQIVKVEFNVQDECITDEQPPNASHEVTGQVYPDEPDTYVNSASLALTATDVGCAGVDTIEYRVNGEVDWHEYTGPVTFDQEDDYSVEYRATDRMENVSAVRTATFSVLEIDDTVAPTVTASLEGSQEQREYYVGSAALSLAADDGPTGSGVETIEYRVNGGDWQTYTEPVVFDDPAAYEVDYRATDKVENTSEPETISFRVLSGDGCTAGRSDEFNGSQLGSQWLRHTRNGGTPTTGPMAPTLAGGQLTMPTNDFELDAASATTALGPVNFIGQDLAALGDSWEVETQFTIQHNGGWQHAGLILWNGDNNFFRSTITHSLSGGNIYIEQSKDNPTTTEGQRVQAGGNVNLLPDDSQPVTIRMRYARAAGSDTVTAQYRVMAPASAANPDWVNFPGAANFLDLNPAGGARRDAAGSRIGIISAGNFPGSTGADPYTGTPANTVVDYFRVTPDDIDCEEVAPTTEATLDPAAPGAGGTYEGPVGVTLSATDGEDAGAAGVDVSEYRIDDGDWETVENTEGDDPFVSSFTVTGNGSHTVEYRSVDKAANVEETQSVSFSIDLPECVHSDEFDGSSLNEVRWPFVRGDGTHPISVGGGQLTVPILDEIDGTRTGPLSLVSQQLPAGTSWVAEAKLTIAHQSSWQQAGLMLWQSDTNFVKVVFSRNEGNGSRYFEISADNPPNNTRNLSTSNGVPATFPTTAYVRLIREGNNLTGAFSADGTTWTPITGNNSTKPVNVTPPREGDGVRIGPYAGSDIDGTFESTASFDYFRFTPDDCPTGDEEPPTTTHELDPAAPGAGGTYDGPVGVTLTATDATSPDPFGLFAATTFAAGDSALAAAVHDVDASGALWDPAALEVAFGDVVRWNVPAESASFPHDVWVIEPGEAPDSAGTQITSGTVLPGGASVSHTLDEAGTWTYVCKVHSFVSEGRWQGMVGTAQVGEDPGPGEGSGVDFTEYRVNTDGATGEWVRSDNGEGDDPFATSFTVSDEGEHTVEYRSTDNAGNAEAIKSVAFDIAEGEPGAPIVHGFADPTSGAAPLLVRFSATAIDPDGGPVSYRWSVEGVGTVVGPEFEHTFTAPGEYTATVTATDDEGDTSSDQVTVTVGGTGNRPPTADATSDVASGAAPLAVQFHALGNDPDGPEDDLAYAWDFGDGGASFEQDPQHTYMEPGTYTATVTVSDAGGAFGTDTVQITVTDPPGNEAPTVEAAALPGSGPAPLEVLLTAQGTDPDGDSLTYSWAFGDGSAPGAGGSVRHTYDEAGTYTATVTASDGNGGTDTAEVQVVVGDPPANQPPTVQAAADPASGTAPLTVRFSASARDPEGGALLYDWSFGDGGEAGGASATHVYGAPGTYTATITVTDARGATATDTVEVVVTGTQGLGAPPAGGDDPAPAPDQPAWFGLNRPAKTTLARFMKRGVAVTVTCTEAMTGSASLKAARSTTRKLGLKSTTLATKSVKCAGPGSKSVTLKPSKRVKRALSNARGAVKVTLDVRLQAAGESTRKVTRQLSLKAR